MATAPWLRRLERDAREEAGTHVLIDKKTGEEFVFGHLELIDAWFGILDCAIHDKAPDPAFQAIFPTEEDPHKLERLVFRDTGEHFWLYPTLRPELREGGETNAK